MSGAKQPSPEVERIVAAAILQDGVVYTAPHHHQIIRYLSVLLDGSGGWKKVTGELGFVTSLNRFVSRSLAAFIAHAAGQTRKEEDPLFSEQLWLVNDWVFTGSPDPRDTQAAMAKRVEELENIAREYIATTDPLVGCSAFLHGGEADEPCGKCRACLKAKVTEQAEEVERQRREMDSLIQRSYAVDDKLEAAESALREAVGLLAIWEKDRPLCSGAWTWGSGGHRRHVACLESRQATWFDPGDIWAYCDEHVVEQDKRDLRYHPLAAHPQESKEKA